MIFLFDLDGTLIQKSEDLFSDTLIEFGICKNKSEYVKKVLINGEKITNNEEKKLTRTYQRKLATYLNSDLIFDEASKVRNVLSLIKKKKAKCYLLTNSPNAAANRIINRLGISSYFDEIHYECNKLNNLTFYSDFINQLKVTENENIYLVEDSLFQIRNFISQENSERVQVFFILNIIYFHEKEFLELINNTIHQFPNLYTILKLYEIISKVFPLTFPFNEYLPVNTHSAPTQSDEIEFSSMLYRELYDINIRIHLDFLDDDSFAWVNKRYFFIIFSLFIKNVNSIYDQVLMKMDFSTGHVKWLLPGGSLKPQKGKDYIDLLLMKLNTALLDKPEIKVRNIFPIADLRNIFVDKHNRVHIHTGIGWSGVISSSIDILSKLTNEIGKFENIFISLDKINSDNIIQSPNRFVFDNAKKVKQKFDFEEEGNLKKFGLFIHKCFVKPFFNIYSLHKKYISSKIHQSKAFSFFDTSCGDDFYLINTLIKSNIKFIVLNDVSTEVILKVKHYIKNLNINHSNTVFFYTIQDATELNNIRNHIFDFVLCKNTLHHFKSRELKIACLNRLKQISRKEILIMDVEYPESEAKSKKNSIKRGLVRLRHRYYMRFLGESGPNDVDTAFLGYEDFMSLISEVFTGRKCNVKFDKFSSPRATYMAAHILMR